MKYFIWPALVAGLLVAGMARAQEPSAPRQDADIALLKKQMLETQAAMQQLQAQHQQQIGALKAQIENQQKLIADLQKTAGVAAPPLPEGAPAPAKTDEPLFPTTDSSVVAGAAPTLAATPPAGPAPAFPTTDPSVTTSPDAAMTTTTATGLTAPITLAGGGKSYLNISFDGMFAAAFSTTHDLDRLEVGDHDPQQRGFNARNLELALDGAVDPYFQAFANIVFKLDNDNETEVEVEEAFMQTTRRVRAIHV